VRDKSQLTSFSINGEYPSNTFSERREWLLRASATYRRGGYSRRVTGDSRASSLTCLSSFSIDSLVPEILLEYDG
jgi:hypothetical protein